METQTHSQDPSPPLRVQLLLRLLVILANQKALPHLRLAVDSQPDGIVLVPLLVGNGVLEQEKRAQRRERIGAS